MLQFFLIHYLNCKVPLWQYDFTGATGNGASLSRASHRIIYHGKLLVRLEYKHVS